MIDSKALREFVESRLDGTGYFLVDLTVSPQNEIKVEVDTVGDADLDRCITLTREIEEEFDRDVEDYELEVGSAGLTAPFKVRGQYEKNLGNQVEVLSSDGKKYKGELTEVSDDSFTIVCSEKVRHEGAKRPVIEKVPHTFPYDSVKRVSHLLEF